MKSSSGRSTLRITRVVPAHVGEPAEHLEAGVAAGDAGHDLDAGGVGGSGEPGVDRRRPRSGPTARAASRCRRGSRRRCSPAVAWRPRPASTQASRATRTQRRAVGDVAVDQARRPAPRRTGRARASFFSSTSGASASASSTVAVASSAITAPRSDRPASAHAMSSLPMRSCSSTMPSSRASGRGGQPGHVHVDGDDLVDALGHRVAVPVGAAAVGAAAHRDHVLRVGHLLVEPLDGRDHLVGDRAGDDHDVGLARAGRQRDDAEAHDVVAGRGEGGAHLDGAAGEAPLVGPEAVLAGGVEEGGQRLRQLAALDEAHVRRCPVRSCEVPAVRVCFGSGGGCPAQIQRRTFFLQA